VFALATSLLASATRRAISSLSGRAAAIVSVLAPLLDFDTVIGFGGRFAGTGVVGAVLVLGTLTPAFPSFSAMARARAIISSR
jgi:hypothetical protein